MYNVFATQVFEKDLKKLSKKYRRIRDDFSSIIEQLEAGEFPGDAIQGFQDKLFKVRVPSSDQKKGKSGGFRVIYYFCLPGNDIFLLTMYAKAKQTDIKKKEIQNILDQLGL